MDPIQRAWVMAHRNVAEELDTRLEIRSGAVPPDLRGVLIHNGPGRLNRGGVEYGHLFDGDGMLLRFQFDGQQIHYRNRFVRTREYLRESLSGRILYRGFGTDIPGGVLANAFRMRFKNAANTNVISHANKVFALWEGGLPHWIDPDSLEVKARFDFDGRLIDSSLFAQITNPELPFSAHPKIDRQTGELFSFGVVTGKKQTLLLYRVGPDGRMDQPVPLELDASTYVHDFTVTNRYRVVFLCPLNSDSLRIVLGLAPPLATMKFDKTRPVEILLVPRDGGPVRRVTMPACFVLHFANAYDDGSKVIVDGLRLPDFPKIPDLLTGAFDRNATPDALLTRFEIDPDRGTVTERMLSDHPVELPTVHPAHHCVRHRYVYAIALERVFADPIFTGLIKVDTETGEKIYREFSPGITAEPLFIPRPDATSEDDGWIVTQLFVASENRSDLLVLDARTMETVCVAAMPHHVPPGFHGTFLPVK